MPVGHGVELAPQQLEAVAVHRRAADVDLHHLLGRDLEPEQLPGVGLDDDEVPSVVARHDSVDFEIVRHQRVLDRRAGVAQPRLERAGRSHALGWDPPQDRTEGVSDEDVAVLCDDDVIHEAGAGGEGAEKRAAGDVVDAGRPGEATGHVQPPRRVGLEADRRELSGRPGDEGTRRRLRDVAALDRTVTRAADEVARLGLERDPLGRRPRREGRRRAGRGVALAADTVTAARASTPQSTIRVFIAPPLGVVAGRGPGALGMTNR